MRKYHQSDTATIVAREFSARGPLLAHMGSRNPAVLMARNVKRCYLLPRNFDYCRDRNPNGRNPTSKVA